MTHDKPIDLLLSFSARPGLVVHHFLSESHVSKHGGPNGNKCGRYVHRSERNADFNHGRAYEPGIVPRYVVVEISRS